MQADQLQPIAIQALNDLKALDLMHIDVRNLTSLTDIMIICSGRSSRHVRSLAENVVTRVKEKNHPYVKMEGEKEAEWIIVDLADVVVHIMLPATRAFYNLEDLWDPILQMREADAHSSYCSG